MKSFYGHIGSLVNHQRMMIRGNDHRYRNCRRMNMRRRNSISCVSHGKGINDGWTGTPVPSRFKTEPPPMWVANFLSTFRVGFVTSSISINWFSNWRSRAVAVFLKVVAWITIWKRQFQRPCVWRRSGIRIDCKLGEILMFRR